MSILSKIEQNIKEFNQQKEVNFNIDSIRIEFSKEYKLSSLKKVGNWHKLKKNSNILHKLKNRLAIDEVTSAYQLEDYNIYYYNSNKHKPRYTFATMVIFGLKQYHKKPPPHHIVNNIVSILLNRNTQTNIINIDVCSDMKRKANIPLISKYYPNIYHLIQKGVFTRTWYINETDIPMIEKITIYDKAYKNKLDGVLWRVEALISIPNHKELCLPLDEFKSVVELIEY